MALHVGVGRSIAHLNKLVTGTNLIAPVGFVILTRPDGTILTRPDGTILIRGVT